VTETGVTPKTIGGTKKKIKDLNSANKKS